MKAWIFDAALVALLGLCGVQLAHAGRPLTTEDAGVIERGNCELESFISRETERDAPRTRGASLQLGCGVGASTQLAAAVAGSRSEGASTRNLTVLGKTALRELQDTKPGLALAYALGLQRLPQQSWKHESTSIAAVLTVPWAGWLGHANLGHLRTQAESRRATSWALAIERPQAVGPVDLMAETFGDDHDAPWFAAAARWVVLPEKFFIDASYGVQASGSRPKQLTVGLKYSF